MKYIHVITTINFFSNIRQGIEKNVRQYKESKPVNTRTCRNGIM